MENLTLKIIKGLKQRKASIYWTVSHILAAECNSNPARYNLNDIEHALREAIFDYFNYCDNPRNETRRLLYEYENILAFGRDNIGVYSRFLTFIQVKEGDKWINGFDESYAIIPVFPLDEDTYDKG